MSMPPIVKWRYDWQPGPARRRTRLYSDFLRPRLGELGAGRRSGASACSAAPSIRRNARMWRWRAWRSPRPRRSTNCAGSPPASPGEGAFDHAGPHTATDGAAGDGRRAALHDRALRDPPRTGPTFTRSTPCAAAGRGAGRRVVPDHRPGPVRQPAPGATGARLLARVTLAVAAGRGVVRRNRMPTAAQRRDRPVPPCRARHRLGTDIRARVAAGGVSPRLVRSVARYIEANPALPGPAALTGQPNGHPQAATRHRRRSPKTSRPEHRRVQHRAALAALRARDRRLGHQQPGQTKALAASVPAVKPKGFAVPRTEAEQRRMDHRRLRRRGAHDAASDPATTTASRKSGAASRLKLDDARRPRRPSLGSQPGNVVNRRRPAVTAAPTKKRSGREGGVARRRQRPPDQRAAKAKRPPADPAPATAGRRSHLARKGAGPGKGRSRPVGRRAMPAGGGRRGRPAPAGLEPTPPGRLRQALSARMRLELKASKAEPRTAAARRRECMAARREALGVLCRSRPSGARRVVLDERGDASAPRSSPAAAGLARDGRDVAIFIGGPHGLDPPEAGADERCGCRISRCHTPFVRVLLADAVPRLDGDGEPPTTANDRAMRP